MDFSMLRFKRVCETVVTRNLWTVPFHVCTAQEEQSMIGENMYITV